MLHGKGGSGQQLSQLLQKDGRKKVRDKYELSMPQASRDVGQQPIFIGMFLQI